MQFDTVKLFYNSLKAYKNTPFFFNKILYEDILEGKKCDSFFFF